MGDLKQKSLIKLHLDVPDQTDKLAFILDGVLSKKECEDYIAMSEKDGYEEALLNVGGGRQLLDKNVRNSSRFIYDSEEQADFIWQRIKPYVPHFWLGRKALGLNERLRFLRYDPGEYFKPHYDGSYVRENGERSYITVQLYLNEGFEGGSTTFLSFNPDQDSRVACVPKIGRALIFQHDMLHEGSILKKGRKYAIRTDIMYTSERYTPEQQAKMTV